MKINFTEIDMNLPEGFDGCERCGDPDAFGVQRAVVAFAHNHDSTEKTVIICCTPHLACVIAEALSNSDGGEFLQGSAQDSIGESDLLAVWEGQIVNVTYPSTPDRAEEYDVEYRGTFRPLTDDEWAAVRAGRTAWPKEIGPEGGDE